MNNIEDIHLINKVKSTSDNSALLELSNRHSGIYNEMVKKYYRHLVNTGLNPDDIISDKLYVLYKSAMSFDPSKNVKFSTWVGNQARYYCLNCMNKNNNLIAMENKDIKLILEKKQMSNDNNESLLKEKSDLIFSILDRVKDSRLSKIYRMRYFSGKKLTPWNKISKKLKISTQTAINLHNKGKKLLKNKLTTLNNIDII
jgi:RNA polymerase sigma factor (sigma-70 family)